MEVLVVFGVVGIIALAISAGRQSLRRNRAQLALIAQELGGPPPDRDLVVRGSFEGRPIQYALVTRGSGKSARSWTEVKTDIPSALRFSLELRAQTSRERSLRDRGLAVDVVVGDPVFDEAFIVEGAPAEIIRELLNPELRQALLALRPVEVTTSAGTMVVASPGQIVDLVPARRLIAAAVALGRVRAASASADAALDEGGLRLGDPYRAEPDADAARAARAARDEELATLTRVREARKHHERLVAGGILLVMVLVFACLAVLRSGGR